MFKCIPQFFVHRSLFANFNKTEHLSVKLVKLLMDCSLVPFINCQYQLLNLTFLCFFRVILSDLCFHDVPIDDRQGNEIFREIYGAWTAARCRRSRSGKRGEKSTKHVQKWPAARESRAVGLRNSISERLVLWWLASRHRISFSTNPRPLRRAWNLSDKQSLAVIYIARLLCKVRIMDSLSRAVGIYRLFRDNSLSVEMI